MSANLITGNLFKPIYAYQDADYQAGISGNVTSIMPVGSQMALSIEDANTIKADDGVLITKEGRRIQIDAGAIEEWSIPTGTQGQTNYYIVGFRLYTGDNSAELCETFVEKMENATDTIPENTFRGGATEVYISLGRVVQSGINLDSVTSLVQIARSFEDVKHAIAQLNSDLGSKSSASAVTGNDAFSKIATLNSDLETTNQTIVNGYIATMASNLNSITSGKLYAFRDSTQNRPSTYGVVKQIQYDDSWYFQIAIDVTGKIWKRQNINNTGWSAWNTGSLLLANGQFVLGMYSLITIKFQETTIANMQFTRTFIVNHASTLSENVECVVDNGNNIYSLKFKVNISQNGGVTISDKHSHSTGGQLSDFNILIISMLGTE